MRKLRVEKHLSLKQLKARIKEAKTKAQFRRWQAIFLAGYKGEQASMIASQVGVATITIYKWIQKYNNNGPEALVLVGRGGRRNELISFSEESKILNNLLNKASKGLIITAKVIKTEVEKKLGRNMAKDYAYDLLHRHGWRKISPRSKHPKQDKEKQETFKKNLKHMWMPS